LTALGGALDSPGKMRLSRNCTIPKAGPRRGAFAQTLTLACAAACAAPDEARPASPAKVERRLAAMGTTLVVEVEAPTRAVALEASEAAYLALEAVERRLSTWTDESELARVNAAPIGELQPLSPELRADLEVCWRWWRESGGAFDPSVGALVELWDLRGAGRIPSAEELRSAHIPRGLPEAFALEADGVVRRVASARFEEGGFGKGVGLDAALAELRARGISRATLDLGGQVAVLGSAQPVRWSIADPRDRSRAVLAWDLSGGSIATSGNSERARSVGGRRIGHLLDPRTGSPAQDFGSVSVWSAKASDADAFSTALFVMGPDAALVFASSREDLAVVVLEVRAEGLRARASSSLRGRLAPLDPHLDLQFEPAATTRSAAHRSPSSPLSND
jgi:thiamine biosynthesis lipoprotein